MEQYTQHLCVGLLVKRSPRSIYLMINMFLGVAASEEYHTVIANGRSHTPNTIELPHSLFFGPVQTWTHEQAPACGAPSRVCPRISVQQAQQCFAFCQRQVHLNCQYSDRMSLVLLRIQYAVYNTNRTKETAGRHAKLRRALYTQSTYILTIASLAHSIDRLIDRISSSIGISSSPSGWMYFSFTLSTCYCPS